MAQIQLIGFKKDEIKNISGKGISFKKIKIPGENCSDFLIKYEISNAIDKSKESGSIVCQPSLYQRDVQQVVLNESVLVPHNCVLILQIESFVKPNFAGTAFIEYEIFNPTAESKIESGMKVFISESDRQNAYRVALTNLARFFNIPNWEYDNNQTLYNKIKSDVNDPIVQLLQKYFKAYDEWFKFYASINEIETNTGQGHILTTEEKKLLAELITNRESALNELQTRFDKLQFEKFQKLNGLENVDGIIL